MGEEEERLERLLVMELFKFKILVQSIDYEVKCGVENLGFFEYL